MSLKSNNGCPHCNKSFKRTKFLKEHVLVCDEIHKSKYRREADCEEENDIPSQKDMYLVLRKVLIKYTALEEEVAELRKAVHCTRKRMNVLKWLQDTFQLDIGFNAWLNEIQCERSFLEYTFEHTYVDGMIRLLLHNLRQECEHLHPIKAFQQKPNVFYIFHDNNWTIMNEHMFDKMLMCANKLLFRLFGEWEEENKERIQDDDAFHKDIYLVNLQTLLGENHSGNGNCEEKNKKKIRAGLFQYLRQNLKSIICFDFTF